MAAGVGFGDDDDRERGGLPGRQQAHCAGGKTVVNIDPCGPRRGAPEPRSLALQICQQARGEL
jgi:hypothetical protein